MKYYRKKNITQKRHKGDLPCSHNHVKPIRRDNLKSYNRTPIQQIINSEMGFFWLSVHGGKWEIDTDCYKVCIGSIISSLYSTRNPKFFQRDWRHILLRFVVVVVDLRTIFTYNNLHTHGSPQVTSSKPTSFLEHFDNVIQPWTYRLVGPQTRRPTLGSDRIRVDPTSWWTTSKRWDQISTYPC